MRVGIAGDHGGFDLKEELIAELCVAGYGAVDFGAHELDLDDDYPDFSIPLARAVASGQVERGVAVCGGGVGASICANKVPGVRAGAVCDHFTAWQGVEDNHMNILCLDSRTVGKSVAWDLVQTFWRLSSVRLNRTCAGSLSWLTSKWRPTRLINGSAPDDRLPL